jgi:hypothetical protein
LHLSHATTKGDRLDWRLDSRGVTEYRLQKVPFNLSRVQIVN